MGKFLAAINKIFVIALVLLATALLILFLYFAKRVYGTLLVNNYLQFLELVIMPAIVTLPFVAGAISNYKATEDGEIKDQLLVGLSNTLFIIAGIMSIGVLADTAHYVIEHKNSGWFEALNFLLYPINNEGAKAIGILTLIFIGGLVTSLQNLPARICSYVSLFLNIFIIRYLYSTVEISEAEQTLAINLLIYGNLVLSSLSVIFAIAIDD